MKSSIIKSVKFRSVFCVLLFLTISATVFGQEVKDTTSDTNNCEVKTEEKKPKLNLKDCAEKDYDCRIAYFTQEIAETTNDPDYCRNCGDYELRGKAYYNKGDYTNALSDFNFVINNSRNDYFAYLYRGKIYEKRGNYDAALSDYLKAYGHPEALLGLGNIARYKRNYEEALEYYNKAIYKDYRLAKAYFGRAVIYLELGKTLNRSAAEEDKAKAVEFFKNAIKDLNSVIEIDLNDTEAETYLRRAQVYEQLGEKEKVDENLQKYVELDKAPKINPVPIIRIN